MKLLRSFFHELNYYTLRLGWRCIVHQKTPCGQSVRKVWQYDKTREVREERFRP
jgi:hypothetical protein